MKENTTIGHYKIVEKLGEVRHVDHAVAVQIAGAGRRARVGAGAEELQEDLQVHVVDAPVAVEVAGAVRNRSAIERPR